MTSKIIAIAKAKIERAKVEIDAFDAAVRDFIGRNSYDITSDLNLDGTEQIWRFRLRNKDTTALSAMVSGIIHNLRSPLDNVVCEVARAYSGTTKDTYFPFGKDIHAFEDEVRKKTRNLPPEALDLIYSLKPYRQGNDLLWALHELNRDDKHPGLDAVSNVQGWQMAALGVSNGHSLIIGNRWGQHLVCNGYKPKFFGLEAMSEDGEFLTTTPGAEIYFEGKPTFQVAFHDVKGFGRQPAVNVLLQMRDLAESVVQAFVRKFF